MELETGWTLSWNHSIPVVDGIMLRNGTMTHLRMEVSSTIVCLMCDRMPPHSTPQGKCIPSCYFALYEKRVYATSCSDA